MTTFSVATNNSVVARFFAKQLLGPAPNANQCLYISSVTFSSHLSGRNCLASGKTDSSKCSWNAEHPTTVSGGKWMPLKVQPEEGTTRERRVGLAMLIRCASLTTAAK